MSESAHLKVQAIPERQWFRRLDDHAHRTIQRFVNEARTGTISINLNQGTPTSIDLKEHVRLDKKRDGL